MVVYDEEYGKDSLTDFEDAFRWAFPMGSLKMLSNAAP